jgi:nucleotide-binding universal stress UspA family protein
MTPRSPVRAPRPWRRILVATDFSTGAQLAMRRAAALPLARAAGVELVHALPARDPSMARLDVLLERDGRHRLGRAVEAVRRALRGRPDVRVSATLVRGPAAVEIVRLAERRGAELIVIGRRGQGRLRHLLLGSVAERVVRLSGPPVLVASASAKRPYRRLLAAVDFQATSRRALQAALRLAAGELRRACLVHVLETVHPIVLRRAGADERQVRAQLAAARARARTGVRDLIASLPQVPGRWTTILCAGDPRHVILAEIERVRPDLVALGTRGLQGLRRVLLGSVAESVLRRMRCEVVVVAGPGGQPASAR